MTESVSLLILWCNNAGGGGIFLKSKAVSSKVHRNTETVILEFSCFSPLYLWDLRKAGTFSQTLFCP